MKHTSRKLIETAAEVLNRHVVAQDAIGIILTGGADPVVTVVNEILSKAAEGGRLVSAVESDGTLLGFVPRADVPIPEAPPRQTAAKPHPEDPS